MITRTDHLDALAAVVIRWVDDGSWVGSIGGAVDVALRLDILAPGDEEFRCQLITLVGARLCGELAPAAACLAGEV